MLGIILAITAAFCWGISAIFVRLSRQEIRISTATLISMISSVLLVGLLALFMDFDNVISLSLTSLWWFSVVGVITYVIGRQCNYSAIRRIGAARATPLFSAAPLFALILAVVFLGESINVPIVLGTLSIAVGLYLVVTSQ